MNTKEKNFEKELPDGYKEIFRFNAQDKKSGLILNGVAVFITVLVIIAACMMVDVSKVPYLAENKPFEMMLYLFILAASLLLYTVLHELVHGAVYKAMTGEKLTFGMSWSCAFCGIPNIYVYRKAAFLAVIAPFVVFSVLFFALPAVFYFVNPFLFLISAIILGMHLGGCSGDLYISGLLLFKYKQKDLLIRDTGPEQFIYVKE